MTARRRPRRAVRPGDAEQRRDPGPEGAQGPGRAERPEQRERSSRGERPTGSSAGGRGTADVLPDRAAEDTDAAWGERDDGDDERLRRDVPPHW